MQPTYYFIAALAGLAAGNALAGYFFIPRIERRLRQHLETLLVKGAEEARAQLIAQIPDLIARGGVSQLHRKQVAAGILAPEAKGAANSREESSDIKPSALRGGRFLRPHPNYFPPAVTDPEVRKLLIRRSRKARVNSAASFLFKALTLGMFPHYSFLAFGTDREGHAISLAVRKARAKAALQDPVE